MTRHIQRLFDFDKSDGNRTAADPVRLTPDPEAEEAVQRLNAWLTDSRGKPVSELGAEALHAVRMAMSGKNAYVQKAEDLLLALQLRNGRTEGDDIVSSPSGEKNFYATAEEVLSHLDARVMARTR